MRQIRLAGQCASILLPIFLLSLPLSMLNYPGGSWANSRSPGFRLFVNYWCDLMRTTAMNGVPNATSAALARLAFCALAASLSAYWWVAASLVNSVRLARWGVVTGTASSVCLVLVALLPYDTQRVWHSVTTLSAGGFGLSAAAMLILGSVRSGGPVVRWRHGWGVALLAAAMLNIGLYVDIVLRGDRDTALLPIIQELATLFLVCWMVATLLDTQGAPPVASSRT